MKLQGIAITLLALMASSAQAATSCPNEIAACGCVITAAGSYTVAANLNQTIIGATCIEVNAARVRLDLAGHSGVVFRD